MKNAGLILLTLVMSQVSFAAAVTPLFTGSESRPADAIVLFDGKDLSGWVRVGDTPAEWKVVDGYMEVTQGNIVTKQQFGDSQIHVEFWVPLMEGRQGQARGNSGVYMQGRYEVQILDSYGLKSSDGDCGGLYGIAAPLVNACRPPETWQTYDIVFHAAKFDAQGKKTEDGRATVFQNGVLIQDNVRIPVATRAAMSEAEIATGPLLLQDHHCPVRYRNIWYRPLTK